MEVQALGPVQLLQGNLRDIMEGKDLTKALECKLSLYLVEKAMGRGGQILDGKET